MNFEKKIEVAKVLASSFINTMKEQNVPLEDCVDILGITAASICGGVPAPLDLREQTASFLASFTTTLSYASRNKEG